MMRHILLGLIMCIPLTAEAVMVYLSPSSTDIHVGDIFTVDILADIDTTEPVLGWGLDIQNPSGLLTQITSPLIGSTWFPASGLDGDGLAGLAFPTPVTGDQVLLASLNYQANNTGIADLIPSYTPGDFTEGFLLAPPNLGFASTNFVGLTLQVKEKIMNLVPAPGTGILVALVLGGILFRTRIKDGC